MQSTLLTFDTEKALFIITRQAKLHCEEAILAANERLQLQREEVFAQLSAVHQSQHNWELTIQQEAQSEIIRLREELLHCRRSEKQKEREISFLQKQLSDAAARLLTKPEI